MRATWNWCAPCAPIPGLHIKAYTAVEIDYFAKTAGLSESTVLDQLKDAGMDAMPGGGAEIFSDRLYRQHWKNKTSPEGWVRIHQLAHGKGIPTNATMLFGFGDTWEERIEHLLILRQAQDHPVDFPVSSRCRFSREPAILSTTGPRRWKPLPCWPSRGWCWTISPI
jgi:2-iminoacetate synthase ThiH